MTLFNDVTEGKSYAEDRIFMGTFEQDSEARLNGSSSFSTHHTSPFINKANLDRLARAYNKHSYTSPTAGTNGTFFRIGPLTYGDEVQGIQIIEEKAIGVVEGVRSNSDFLIDSGVGDADIKVSMIFSGHKHINEGLRPLIALFKVSPIISVKNSMIKAALYNEFTENQAYKPGREIMQEVEDTIRQFNEKQNAADPNSGLGSQEGQTAVAAQFVRGILTERNAQEETEVTELDSRVINRRYDETGHVPVAMFSMEVATHPELEQAVIVNLFLKRINVGNYLSQYLRYRTVDNTATEDPTKAFWLKRAIDIYIERYIPTNYLSPVYDDPSRVVLSYSGDNVELQSFKDSHEINKLLLNDPAREGVVTQMSYSVTNKFAFHRLIGESYPTAQFMGTTNGSYSLSIRAINDGLFSKLHKQKSAADFFVRHTDKISKFNGWSLDSLFTRLFNENEYAEKKDIQEGDDINNRAFYPLHVASTTVSDSPGLRDVNIVFRETNPDFFSDFGFSIKKGGYSIEILYKMYMKLFERADEIRSNALIPTEGREGFLQQFAYDVIYGKGDARMKYCVVNSDTLLSAMLENDTVNIDNDFAIELDIDLGKELLLSIIPKELFSGILNTNGAPTDIIFSEVASLLKTFIPGRVSLDNEDDIIPRIIKKFFSLEKPDLKAPLARFINRIPTAGGRRDLYELLMHQPSIKLTDEFKKRLFASIIKRSTVPLSDRLYSRSGVIRAYDSLTLALDTAGDEFLESEDISALGRRGTTEDRLRLDSDGKLRSDAVLVSCYSDFIYITYAELFNLTNPGTNTVDNNNWEQYAPSYQDYGIINRDDESLQNGFTATAVELAQNRKIVIPASPVPPSIFFHREPELENMRTAGFEDEIDQWFENLSTKVVRIPFDTTTVIRDAFGRDTGVTSNAVPEAGSDLQTRIEEILGEVDRFTPGSINKAAEELIAQEFNYQAQQANRSVSEFSKKSRTNEFYEAIHSLSSFEAKADPSTGFKPPALIGTKGDAIAQYIPISGTAGASIARGIINMAAGSEDATSVPYKNYIDSVITKSASGAFNHMTISNSNLEEIKVAMNKITQSIPDNGNDLIKAFPTMRLYIVDFRGSRILVQDNFYGYHAIHSIDITLDKYDAALAVIRIADPLHILQEGEFDDSDSNINLIDDTAIPLLEGDESNVMNRIKLRQGRGIQIRAGYSSDPDHLDIIFTGKITEIQHGDMITVIAQEWKAELMGRQVEFELGSEGSTSVKDLVVRTIRDSNPNGFGEVFSHEEFKKFSEVLGGLAASEVLHRSVTNTRSIRSGASSGAPGISFNVLGKQILDQYLAGVDTRLKNVWMPDEDRETWGIFWEAINAGWNGHRWTIPMTPAWDVLQSATNYSWGYICQTVPYDGESTLFFGRPDQMYFYTHGNNRTARKYRQARAKTVDQFVQNTGEIFAEFILSRFYTNPEHNNVESLPDRGIRGTPSGIFLRYNADDLLREDYVITVGGSPDPTVGSGHLTYNINSLNNSYTLYKKLHSHTDKKSIRFSAIDERDEIARIFASSEEASMFILCSFYGFSPSSLHSNNVTAIGLATALLSKYDSTSELKSAIKSFTRSGIINEDIFGLKKAIAEVKKDFPAFGDYIKMRNALANNSELGDIPIHKTGITISGRTRYVVFLDSRDHSRDEWHRSLGQAKYGDRKIGEFFQEVDSALRFKYPAIELETLEDANYPLKFYEEALKGEISLAESFGFNATRYDFKKMARQLENQDLIDDIETAEREGTPDKLLEVMFSTNSKFRAYVYFLAQYLIENETTEAIRDNLAKIKESKPFDGAYAHNMKVFRNYHYIRNGIDIIDNSLAATTREMSNSVVVRYPHKLATSNDWWLVSGMTRGRILSKDYDSVQINSEVTWSSYPEKKAGGHVGMQFDDTITLADKKITVYTDLNTSRKEQAATVATNVLTKSMRPMYRNSITILGRHIKPWDYVYLKDKYTEMSGMLDVERVVHHYDSTQGWVTKIIPHAVCEANPGNSYIQSAIISSKMDRLFDVVDFAFNTVALAALGPTAKALTVPAFAALKSAGILTKNKFNAQARKIAGKKIARSAANKDILEKALTGSYNSLKTLFAQALTVGAGSYISNLYLTNMRAGGESLPVTFMPIMYQGAPLQAGLHGTEKVYWSMGSKVHWALHDKMEGVKLLGYELNNLFSPAATPVQVQANRFGIVRDTDFTQAE